MADHFASWYNQYMHVLLIGPRASGKTTLGTRLAQERRQPFIDLDDRALARFAQSSVSEVWHAHGEENWRNAELQALAEALAEPDSVIALGGGTPMIPEARKRLEDAQSERRVFVVYLCWDESVLVERLRQAAGDRPSLTGLDPATELPAVIAEREPTYRALADLVWQGQRELDENEAIRDLVEHLSRTMIGRA